VSPQTAAWKLSLPSKIPSR